MTDPCINNMENLLAHINAGNRVKYLFFWGHKKTGKEITKSCLSQWYDSPFEHEGITYKTAEHFMMAMKAKLFDDLPKIQEILDANDPGKAKSLGRTIKNFDQKIWDENKTEIVIHGNLAKFRQHEDLKEFLINTKARILVEASPVDKVWGIGLTADDPQIQNPESWKGQNLLGFALMAVRKKLSSNT